MCSHGFDITVRLEIDFVIDFQVASPHFSICSHREQQEENER